MIDRSLLAHWEQARADGERAVEFAEGQIARIAGETTLRLVVDNHIADANKMVGEDNEPPDAA